MNVNGITDISGVLGQNQAAGTQSTDSTYFSNYMNQASLSCGDYLEQIFQKASDTYNVSKDLLKAMAKAESNFRSDATSHSGAMGIMQLMPATAASLGVSDAYNPEQNIMGGAQYISRLLEKYSGNIPFALAAYNAGSGNVEKYGGIPPFKETQNYVTKILGFLQEGVTIPDSTTSGSPAPALASYAQGQLAGTSSAASGSTNTLGDILNRYFDYDDYLEFLQLFTRVIYEKLTGTELESGKQESESSTQTAASGQAQQAAQPQEAAQAKEPVKVLAMKIKDGNGVNTFQQPESSGDAYKAFQYMTAGGQSRMSVFLNKTV